MFGIVVEDAKTGVESNELYPNKQYLDDSGQHVREMERKKTVAKEEKITAKLLEKLRPTPSAKSEHFESYIRFQLQNMKRMQDVYMNPKIAKTKFIAHQRRQAIIQTLVNKYTKNENVLWFEGDSKIAADSPMRGYVRLPNSSFLNALRLKCDIIEVPEYNTTQMCSKCLVPILTSKSPHRYQYCNMCKTTWNRDINAAIY